MLVKSVLIKWLSWRLDMIHYQVIIKRVHGAIHVLGCTIALVLLGVILVLLLLMLVQYVLIITWHCAMQMIAVKVLLLILLVDILLEPLLVNQRHVIEAIDKQCVLQDVPEGL